MAHDHAHHHHADFTRRFGIGVALNLAYAVAEAAFGLFHNSLALLADAGHNLGDVAGLFLAWGAAYMARLPPTESRTYGWRSSTILAALGNALLLLVAVGGIAWEAVRRFGAAPPVAGGALMAVAAVGVLVNGVTALLFLKGRKDDLNVRGAFLHMVADTAVTLGVIVAGLLILKTGEEWIDPAVSLLIALAILFSTWGLLRDSFNMALHAVPPGVDLGKVREYLLSLPGITAVHDLHVWSMSTTEKALTAHLIRPDPAGDDDLLERAGHDLHDRFGIEHSTLQLGRSPAAHVCRPAAASPAEPDLFAG